MKKLAFLLLALPLVFVNCKKSASSSENASDAQAITQRSCGAYEVLQKQLQEDPGMQERMNQIDAFTDKMIASGNFRVAGSTINIPVVVHVVYKTSAQNISDAQINSQIAVLNEDYNSQNADKTKLPANSFQTVASPGFNVNFYLAQTIRKSTKTRSFSTNDAVKYSSRGGDNVVNPARNLNLWVCNLGGGLLGYGQFPGGKAATDGVVILYSAFGSRAKYPGGTYLSTFDLGRTGTHEIGHWMNLRHIWGDDNGACTGSDLVADTPNQGNANYGCPSYPKVSCNNGPKGDMFMNFMDYTDDVCMYTFSAGQQARALAVFATGGPRATIGQ